MGQEAEHNTLEINPEFSRIFHKSMENLSELQKFIEIIKIFVDETYEGIIIMDEKGVVRYTNRRHAEYFNTPQNTVLHKHISEMANPEIVQGFLDVIKTGKPDFLRIFQDGGREFIANRFPLKKDGKVLGAAGIVVFDIKEVDVINKKITRLENKLAYYKEQLKSIRSSRYSFENIIGESVAIKQAIKEAGKAAKKDSHVLLVGESGTGKELFAHAIHNQSQRKRGAFVGVNCSAIPHDLLESELFGFEAGSFTGARTGGKKGKFELADKGTIFLDEIGEMPLQMQSKLLRVLQEKEIDRIGGTKATRVDFRLIAATNADLREMVDKGTFRKDLYYRLNVIKIEIPPLRNRIKDVPILARSILEQKAQELGIREISIGSTALSMLGKYDYPGNVRELINILEKAINSTDSEESFSDVLKIDKEEVTSALNADSPPIHPQKWSQLREQKQDQEAHLIREALRAAGGNISRCADLMGIHRTGLHRKIKQYNLHHDVLAARQDNKL